MTSDDSSINFSVIVNENLFNDELLIPSSLSSIISKYEDKSASFCVTNRIIVERGPTYLFCSTSTPLDDEISAS